VIEFAPHFPGADLQLNIDEAAEKRCEARGALRRMLKEAGKV
jgi:hypothetical protein